MKPAKEGESLIGDGGNVTLPPSPISNFCRTVLGTSRHKLIKLAISICYHKQKYADGVIEMERQLPKNVRQIGNVSDNPKIYVEDYVDTYINQLCDKVENMPIGAFLIGEKSKNEDQEYIFIHGAIQIHDLEMKGSDFAIEDTAWKRAYEECKQFFETGEIMGWFVSVPGYPMNVNERIVKMHEKSFSKKSSILIMKEPVEKEEIYYAYKLGDLMELGGHYIYYEKNPCMQEYMISSRRENGVTPSEAVEDRATKDFRSLIRTREEANQQKMSNRFVYAASTFLVIVVLVIGITTVNNYDKMQAVQHSLKNISDSVSKGSQASANDQAETEQVEKTEQAVGNVEAEDAQAVNSTDVTNPSAQEAEVQQAQAEAVANADQDIYIVQKGDTLAKISKKAYGDVTHVDSICKMNGLENGNLIYIGQKLLLP
ncbi:LysM peptidoglycan-binding domain-containing protein [Lachnospiraceae bacterium LCP25S3_G4]